MKIGFRPFQTKRFASVCGSEDYNKASDNSKIHLYRNVTLANQSDILNIGAFHLCVGTFNFAYGSCFFKQNYASKEAFIKQAN